MLTGANPTIFGTPIPKEHQANIDKYTPEFVDALEAAALAAIKDLKPAKLSWGVGKATFAMNRRKRAVAPTDHDLPVLFVKDEKGKVRAVYLAYACHAVTLSHNKIGGDWAGLRRRGHRGHLPGRGRARLDRLRGRPEPELRRHRRQGRCRGRPGPRDRRRGQAALRELPRPGRPARSPRRCKRWSCRWPTSRPARQWEEKAKRMDAIGHHARVTLAQARPRREAADEGRLPGPDVGVRRLAGDGPPARRGGGRLLDCG